MKDIPIRKINIPPKEPIFSQSFSIRNIRDLVAGKDMIQELHRHDFFFILALKKGAGEHEIDFTPYTVDDHSVFFIRPGQVHRLTLKARSTGYLIALKTDLYPHDKVMTRLLRKAGDTTLYQLHIEDFKKLHVVLTYIFQEHTDKQEGYQEVVKANLEIFLIKLIRHRQGNKNSANRSTVYAQERLEKLTELLETHISTHKQVAQYADMLSLSAYQLNSITKETLGKTCSELINEHIILESKRYLVATSNQINQIAYRLGYEDVSYFIRFFKKHTGHTPEAFRLNFR